MCLAREVVVRENFEVSIKNRGTALTYGSQLQPIRCSLLRKIIHSAINNFFCRRL